MNESKLNNVDDSDWFGAEEMKCMFIEYLFNKYKNRLKVLGNECLYGSEKRKADLVALIDNKTVAIEIKSHADSIERLQEQLNSYNKVFDSTWVVISSEKITQTLSKSGFFDVYLLDNLGRIKKIKTSGLKNNLDNFEMLDTINARFLKKHVKCKKINSIYELRFNVAKDNKKNIRKMLRDFLYEKYSEKFYIFKNEVKDCITLDDLPTLSKGTVIV